MFKLLSCVTAVGCIAGVPLGIFYSHADKNINSAEKIMPVVDLPKKQPLILKSSSGNGELSLNNMDKLFENEGKPVSFEEVDMKFGSYKLSNRDLLISPKKNGIYYLAKWVHGSGGNWYKLENEKVVYNFDYYDAVYGNLNRVELNSIQGEGGSGDFPSTISVGTCNFWKKQHQNFDLVISFRCQDNWRAQIQGTLSYKTNQ